MKFRHSLAGDTDAGVRALHEHELESPACPADSARGPGAGPNDPAEKLPLDDKEVELDGKPQKREQSEKSHGNTMTGGGIAVGVSIGVALGVAMDSLAMGLAIGLALGVALGAAGSKTGS